MNQSKVHDNAVSAGWKLRWCRELEPGQYAYRYLSKALKVSVIVSFEDSVPFTGFKHAVHLSVAGFNLSFKPSWKQIQLAKNDFLGPESIAVQYYPKESELLDITNTYHIWSVES